MSFFSFSPLIFFVFHLCFLFKACWLTLLGGGRIEEKDEARLAQMQRRVELAFGSGQFVCMGRMIALISTYKALAEVSALFFSRGIKGMSAVKRLT